MSVSEPQSREDAFSARRARNAVGLLAAFNEVGLLSAADVHVAARVTGLVGETDESLQLALALAVRATRLGHVFVDLLTIHDTASLESEEEPLDLGQLAWPPPQSWVEAVAAGSLVAIGEDAPAADRPLRLIGTRLYLDRYWREERSLATDLLTLTADDAIDLNYEVLADGLPRLFPQPADARQRLAAAAAVYRRFAVVAGGPGTGKTTTVARIVALLAEQAVAQGARPPLVALCAPTGKASARLQEAVHAEATDLDVAEEVRTLLVGLQASTLHRLLGWRRGSHSRFGYDRGNRLPHDVVIVDETSMVSLSMMGRLVEAVRSDARLVLVGDPGQLRSIEAGVVLGDVVGPVAEHLRMTAGARARLAEVTGDEVPADDSPPDVRIGDGIVVLDRVHRYGSGIAALAEAIRQGDGDGTIASLMAAPDEITWLAVDVEDADAGEDLHEVRKPAVAAGRSMFEAARTGAAMDALGALGAFRLLCAHRRGPHGVSNWSLRLQAWLGSAVADLDLGERDYVGRPLLVTENDYELGLYNGDTGVIVADDEGRPSAVFERAGELLSFSPLRLDSVETVYAMTIHKSQGSQFETAAVMLPPATSRILTRELLYTAVTRAQKALILVATEDAIRAAVARPVARASGLRERLWGDAGGAAASDGMWDSRTENRGEHR